MKIGDTIKEKRKEKGFTQGQLAQLSEIPAVSLGRYERNETTPSLEILDKISKALGVSMSFFNEAKKGKIVSASIKATDLGKITSFDDMINSLHDPFLGRSKQEIINMCKQASKILEVSNLKITCVEDEDFDFLIHILDSNTGKTNLIHYDEFFVEAEKITWLIRSARKTLLELE